MSSRIEITASPEEADETFVVAQTRAFNQTFVDDNFEPLCAFVRDDESRIIGGLVGKTYWNYLEISFLWVGGDDRGSGLGTRLVESAEAEALSRGCQHALLDTYSFQALPFYEKLGYREFGQLKGFCDQHLRHYLYKKLLKS